ncbi:hypothetical protein QMZ05_32840 [Bradyrhizobium sp. INPA03-11B]
MPRKRSGFKRRDDESEKDRLPAVSATPSLSTTRIARHPSLIVALLIV